MARCIGRPWGSIATDILDGPDCVLGCRDSFRRSFVPDNQTFERVCERLEQLDEAARASALMEMYCCDSQICGVDNISQPGDDPNVNWAINFCQSNGFVSISDPGPPAATHVCTNPILPGCASRCLQTTTSDTRATALPTEVSTSTTPSDSKTLPTTLSATSSLMVPSATSATGDGQVPTSIPSIQDPSLTASLSGSVSDNGNSGLSTASKIIIGATIPLALIAVIIAVLWRRRARQRNNSHPTETDTGPPSLNVSPAPDEPSSASLVSPSASYLNADDVPLTPPPRLQERRLLPSKSREQPSPNSRPSRLHPGFHIPLKAPTGTSDNTAGNAGNAGAILLPKTAYSPPYPQPSSSAYTVTDPSPKQQGSVSAPTTPLSGKLSPRMGYTATMGGAAPGPPPDRALPSTPPARQTKTSADKAAREPLADEIGVALEFPPQNDTQRQMPPSSPRQQSWWAWGIPEEGPYVGAGPSSSRTRGERSPVMNEKDLERLGGTY